MKVRMIKSQLKHHCKGILLLLITLCLLYRTLETIKFKNLELFSLEERNATYRSQAVLSVKTHLSAHNVTELRKVGQPATKKPVDTYGCDKWFEESFEDNLRTIAKYPRGEADVYLKKLNRNIPKQKLRFPVIVTAANSGFYAVSQGLLQSIHEILLPKYKDIKIIYYDMGLTQPQSVQLKKYCKCDVRTFPFEEYPPHVKQLKTYTWKPLIVKSVVQEYDWVWWMDSSVRFVSNDLDRALNYSVENSMLFFTYDVVFAVAQHTDVQTMDFLQEDRCKFRHFGEIEATFVLFHSDRVTDILVDQWAACALNVQCMAPAGTESKLWCSINNKSDGRCHRFDQAVLSIFLRRLYHDTNNYPLVKTPFQIHEVIRGQSVQYFPE